MASGELEASRWSAERCHPSREDVPGACYQQDVTSTIIAIVALIVSVASAVFACWQAVEARRVRQIEGGRRHEERTPTFHVEVERVNGGQWHRLWVILTSGEALDSLAVTILDPQLAWFPSGQAGVEPGPDSKHASWGHVAPGVRDVAFRVEWEDDDSHLLRLALRSTRAAETWDVHSEVELPAKPYNVVD